MADRTVSVVLRAQIGDFVAEMRIAGGAVDDFGKKVDGTGKKTQDSFKKTDESAKQTSQSVQKASVSTGQWITSLVAGAAAVSGPFAAAAGAVAAFGAVAAPSIVKVVKAQADLNASWTTLDSRQQASSAHLGAVIGEYQSLAKAYEPQALSVFNSALGDTSVLMQRAKPLLDAGAQGVGRFTSQIDSFVTGGTMQKFLSFEATQAGPALDQLGQGLTQTGSLALNLAHDLTPMGMTLLTSANSGLRFLNTVEQISPHLTEAAVTAIALRAPTQALSDVWDKGSTKVGTWASKTAEADGKLTKLAKGALSADGFLGKLGRTISAAPSLYIGAALGVAYLTQRLSTMKDAQDQVIDSVRTENNAFGNNIAGHQAAAASLTTYINQERAAKAAATEGAGAINEQQHVATVYNGQIAKLVAARKQELTAANNITAGEKDLSQQYGISATQANQLATAAGVDLSKGITGSGAAAQAAQAKIRAYQAAVIAAADPTRVISQALDAAGNSTLALKDRMTALTNAWNAAAGPAIQAFDATTKTAQAFSQLDAALKKSKGSMSLTSAAGQNARAAFAQLYTTVEQGIQAQYQYTSATQGAAKANTERVASTRSLVPLLLAEAGGNKQAQQAVLKFAQSGGLAADSVRQLAGQLNLSKSAFLAAAHDAGIGEAAAKKLWAAFNKLPAVKDTRLHNNAEERRKAVQDYQAKLDALHGKNVTLHNNAGSQMSAVQAYQNKLDSLHGKTVTVHTVYTSSGSTTFGPGNKKLGNADGNIYRYADGESHVAQIAPAGAMRLWAEPETGGEAYIPLASSKRQRSTMLLSDVAGMFGLAVVKPMAAGGILSFASGGTVGDLSLSTILSDWTSAVKPSTKAQVDSAIKSRRTQVNQLANAEDALARARKKGNARDIAAAERRVTAERQDLAAATSKLADVEARYRFTKQKPATQLGSALTLDIKSTASFIKNLTTLTDKGYGTLAQQLLAMGGPEAEKIAADAVKLSASKLSKLNSQVGQSQAQATQLANLPAILATRAAVKAGKGSSWVGLLDATGLTPDVLAIAVQSMLSDLNKTTQGKALIADMHAHGYARGGEITGRSGVDANLIRATAGEFMVREGPAKKYKPWLGAMNDGTFDQFIRHMVSGGSGGRAQAAPAAAAAGPTIHNNFQTQEMNAAELSRNVSREIAWQLSP